MFYTQKTIFKKEKPKKYFLAWYPSHYTISLVFHNRSFVILLLIGVKLMMRYSSSNDTISVRTGVDLVVSSNGNSPTEKQVKISHCLPYP